MGYIINISESYFARNVQNYSGLSIEDKQAEHEKKRVEIEKQLKEGKSILSLKIYDPVSGKDIPEISVELINRH